MKTGRQCRPVFSILQYMKFVEEIRLTMSNVLYAYCPFIQVLCIIAKKHKQVFLSYEQFIADCNSKWDKSLLH